MSIKPEGVNLSLKVINEWVEIITLDCVQITLCYRIRNGAKGEKVPKAPVVIVQLKTKSSTKMFLLLVTFLWSIMLLF